MWYQYIIVYINFILLVYLRIIVFLILSLAYTVKSARITCHRNVICLMYDLPQIALVYQQYGLESMVLKGWHIFCYQATNPTKSSQSNPSWTTELWSTYRPCVEHNSVWIRISFIAAKERTKLNIVSISIRLGVNATICTLVNGSFPAKHIYNTMLKPLMPHMRISWLPESIW